MTAWVEQIVRNMGQNYSNVSNVIQWATYAVIAVVVGSIIRWVIKRRGWKVARKQ